MPNDPLPGFVAAAKSDIEPLLRTACGDLYIDDSERLTAFGVLLARAWTDGATAGCEDEEVAEAVKRDLVIDESAVAALANKVVPAVSVRDILRAIASRARATRGATSGSATRAEIASELSVAADAVSREGSDPDGPLGRAVELGYVEPNPRYKGYWRLTPAGDAQLP